MERVHAHMPILFGPHIILRRIWLPLFCGPLLLLCACSRPEAVSESLTQNGRTATVILPRSQADELSKVSWVLREKIKKIDGELNLNEADSELSRLNRIAPETRLPVSKSIQPIVRLALHYTERTDGLFDVTLGPTAALWGLRGARPPRQPPPPELIEAARTSSGTRQIELTEYSISFGTPYTRLDLLHIENGYILDLAIQELRRRQIKNVCLSIGDRFRVLGRGPDGQNWRVPLPHPTAPDQLLGHLALRAGQAAVVVDGREDSVIIAGVRYNGRLDPRTGRPADYLLSVVTTGPSTTEAEVLASALFAGGPESAETLARNFPRCEFALWPADESGVIWCTPGMPDHLELTGGAQAGSYKILSPTPAL